MIEKEVTAPTFLGSSRASGSSWTDLYLPHNQGNVVAGCYHLDKNGGGGRDTVCAQLGAYRPKGIWRKVILTLLEVFSDIRAPDIDVYTSEKAEIWLEGERWKVACVTSVHFLVVKVRYHLASVLYPLLCESTNSLTGVTQSGRFKSRRSAASFK